MKRRNRTELVKLVAERRGSVEECLVLTNLVCEDLEKKKKILILYKALLLNFQNWVWLVTEITGTERRR